MDTLDDVDADDDVDTEVDVDALKKKCLFVMIQNSRVDYNVQISVVTNPEMWQYVFL